MLNICKKLEEGKPHGMLCQKRKMDGCALWMKRDGLYTSHVVESETINMEFVKQGMCSI